MQGWQWIDNPSPDIFQRYCGMEAERWWDERECWSWRPRHSDGSPTCCSSSATLNSPSELMGPTSCLPVSLFLSYPLFLYQPSPIPVFIFKLCLSDIVLSLSITFSLHLYPTSSSNFFSFLCVSFDFPTHSPCQLQAGEPWKCHTDKVRGSISFLRWHLL